MAKKSISLLIAVILLCGAALAQHDQKLVSEIIIHGNRGIPAETLKSRMFTRSGDVYDQAAIERDFNSLWNTGYFEDLRIEREETPQGWRIHVYVKEKPTIRTITYPGINSITTSDILERFKERKLSMTPESKYDPTKVKRAEVVIKELLSEHGRQYATVKPEVHPIPPAAVELIFVVKEGPKVKVGKIKFEGNKALTTRILRSSMRNSRPIGIPKSIFLENIFAKTYNAVKLGEDVNMIRDAYQQKGYFKAVVQDPKTQIHDTTGFHIPLLGKGKGKAVDITIPVEEGSQYRLASITFTGNKAITDNKLLRRLIPMKDGEIFNVESLRKGLRELQKAFGAGGYVNYSAVPDIKFDDDKKLITVVLDIDEGKQFYVRRIEFVGNTTTRDKVIRRELAVEEGNIYNSRYWELSLLRLNQLGYFEPLKTEGQPGERSDEVKTNNQDGTVDITLKVKEKGKNSIGLTGGVSGLAGSFIGINYQTNNFLGLGETLRVEANIGSRERNVSFGFTEPYAFDRPLQLGFNVYTRKYDFNQAKESAISTGVQTNLPQNVLEQLQNFSQSSTGFSLSANYALHRSFKRIGLTYSLDNSTIKTFSQASQQYFEFLNFRGISGPNSLEGIVTSKITPSFSFSTIDNPQRPHSGHSFFLATDLAGLGGSVREIRPVMEYKQFIPMKALKPSREGRNALGFRVQTSFLTGYAGKVAPPFDRFYLGGDNDVRGFDVRSSTPYAFITTRVNFTLMNPDGTAVPVDPNNPRRGNMTVPIPVQQIVFTGGDTNIIGNVEYRIPIAGPVTLAPFMDFGMNFVARESQLRLSDVQIKDLNSSPFGCPRLDAGFNCVGGVPIIINPQLSTIAGTNFVPRMSTGLELQVIMPIVNAPFRLYWAYNPLRLDTFTNTPIPITRSMFPDGAAGDFSFKQAISVYAPSYLLREPRKTFRFTVSTTF